MREVGMDHTGPASTDGVYGISVAADMVGMPTQSLRLYEKRGLLEPSRTAGGTRLYSADDIDRLRHIGELLQAGINIAGVERILGLEADNVRLQSANTKLKRRAETR
jgi:MerR family transcriptional regulator, heat shock protein HspR